MFNNIPPLIFLNLFNCKIENINNMSNMFMDCPLLTSLNLSNI
jgi:hypothetical protein